ncbi:PREDICTED: putative lipoyltransferase 2, mitochondrial [Ceratosolen solmsi marchali]|uniref:Octanoyl-[acyl-carrier-protein]:protein N-octanoyltransferase LIPT2, mitochondrial n=1 Tax=Ceratosolen solmsi marchali TaxID=326594 RepID=A0AAJ7E0G5_9HYME|nr:PREDICTED: putative lipoyltransferase 2, mitochondrial [Ceratosolen solmsi marchali]
MTARIVKVVWTGRLSYKTGLLLQKSLINRHHEKPQNDSPNSLVLLEHNPVYTVGIRNKIYTHEEESRLRALNAEFYRTNRGGLITFHGPGQLVAYPIINLKDFRTNVRCYVSKIERMIIRLCAEFGLKGKTSPDTGVWIEDRKICAIGIHASRFVTSHGLALNCNIDLDWFEHIVPCGIEGKSVASLSKELLTNISVHDVIPVLKRAFSDEFQCNMLDMTEEEISSLFNECRDTNEINFSTSGKS